jgi:hypothetical protein
MEKCSSEAGWPNQPDSKGLIANRIPNRGSTMFLGVLMEHSFIFGLLASMLQNLLIGDEKRSLTRKKLIIGL